MIEMLVTVPRARIGNRLGRLDRWEVARLNQALAFVLGLAD